MLEGILVLGEVRQLSRKGASLASRDVVQVSMEISRLTKATGEVKALDYSLAEGPVRWSIGRTLSQGAPTELAKSREQLPGNCDHVMKSGSPLHDLFFSRLQVFGSVHFFFSFCLWLLLPSTGCSREYIPPTLPGCDINTLGACASCRILLLRDTNRSGDLAS